MKRSALSAVVLLFAGLAWPAAPLPAAEVADYFQSRFGLGLDSIYWGEFHTHSAFSKDAANCALADGQTALTPAQAYVYAREVEGLDFLALSDHAEMPNPAGLGMPAGSRTRSAWQSLLRINLACNNELGTRTSGCGYQAGARPFIIFPGWEYTNTYGVPVAGSADQGGYGHKNVIFREIQPERLPARRYGSIDPATPVGSRLQLDQDYAYAETAQDLWSALRDEEVAGAITIVHTPAMVPDDADPLHDHHSDWEVMDREFSRQVEICSKWGSSEGQPPAAAGCDLADPPLDGQDLAAGEELTVRSTLYQRWVLAGSALHRLGFVGGTDSHWGLAANETPDQCGMAFRGGLTGIAAPAFSRNRLWQAVWQRQTLAVTAGARIPTLLAVETGGRHLLMGHAGPHDGTITVRAVTQVQHSPTRGGGTIDPANVRMQVILNGCLVHEQAGSELEWTGTGLDPAGRAFVYLRVRAESGTEGETYQAWTSPVYLGPVATR
ncbi:MAG: hypothetical protein AB1634_00955 [Thermodesulfobacteriota bacterium]